MSRSQPQETPTQSKRLGQDVIMLVLLFCSRFHFSQPTYQCYWDGWDLSISGA